MKRFVHVSAVMFVLSWVCFAQSSTNESPATKADVERYFQLAKSNDMMKKLMASMTQSIQRMTHEQYLKHQDELPPGDEAKMNGMMKDLFKKIPMVKMWGRLFRA